MKKMKVINTIIIMLLGLLMTSCQKYLDIKKNSQQRFIETADDCQKLLDNYGDSSIPGMNNAFPSDIEGSADEYYYAQSRYNQLDQENKNVTTWNLQTQRNSALVQWQYPYKTVYYANLVLDNLEKVSGTADQNTLDALRGSALFFRAYTFWYLAQLYASPYVPGSANSSPGIPLRLTSDLNDKTERASVQQTYDRILDDLKSAVSLLPVTSSKSSRPNKVAAYAMLARTYMSMEDYPNALLNADAALQLNHKLMDYNSINAASTTPFPRFNDEVIFQAVLGASPGPVTNLVFPGSAFQAGAFINLDLYNSYTSNDLRKTIFFKPNSAAFGSTYRFTGNYDPNTGATLFTGLAVDEMYLTRAECYARAGNKDAAMADLNTLLITRWKKDTYVNMTAVSADEALMIVLQERRKQLLMRGLRWTDLRRLNRDNRFKIDIERKILSGTLPNLVTTVIATLPANDPRYVLLIPSEVISIAGIAQNIR